MDTFYLVKRINPAYSQSIQPIHTNQTMANGLFFLCFMVDMAKGLLKMIHTFFLQHRTVYPVFAVPCCAQMAELQIYSNWFQVPHITLSSSIMQADLLIIFGAIHIKQAPTLTDLYNKMAYPAKVIHLQGCYAQKPNYASIADLNAFVPVHATLADCTTLTERFQQTLYWLRNT